MERMRFLFSLKSHKVPYSAVYRPLDGSAALMSLLVRATKQTLNHALAEGTSNDKLSVAKQCGPGRKGLEPLRGTEDGRVGPGDSFYSSRGKYRRGESGRRTAAETK